MVGRSLRKASMPRRPRAASAAPRTVSLGLALACLAPAAAQAGTIRVSGAKLEYLAGAGAAQDRLALQYRRNRDFFITQRATQVAAVTPCFNGQDPDQTAFSNLIAACPAAGVTTVVTNLGGGNDVFDYLRDETYIGDEQEDGLLPVRVLKGRIDGGSGNDTLDGGYLASGVLFGATGNDSVEGGEGRDVVRGGPGKDIVQGFGGADRVYGDAGPDELLGTGGADRLYGGSGNDKLNGGGFAFGKDKSDRLYGGSGNDKLTDFQNGRETAGDRYSGGAGRDLISDRDGNRDFINCGKGRDTAVVDQRDKVAGNCERVKRKYAKPPG
jgi:Ca2+-binding RTX toxin-like protein